MSVAVLHRFNCANIGRILREMLNISGFAHSFKRLNRDLVNIIAWKNMFDPYIEGVKALMSSYNTYWHYIEQPEVWLDIWECVLNIWECALNIWECVFTC